MSCGKKNPDRCIIYYSWHFQHIIEPFNRFTLNNRVANLEDRYHQDGSYLYTTAGSNNRDAPLFSRYIKREKEHQEGANIAMLIALTSKKKNHFLWLERHMPGGIGNDSTGIPSASG